MINLSIVPKPHFVDAMKIHREQGHQAFLDACSYNHNQALSYRAAKHRLLPLWIRRRKERAVWKHAFITLNKYRYHWTEQRRFFKRLINTRAILKQALSSAS